jgi:hypothetical protein
MSRSTVANNPKLVRSWHPTRNDPTRPREVLLHSGRKLWWRCRKGPDHEWQAPAYSRAAGSGCPFCAGKRVSITNSLVSVSPETAEEWHPSKNRSLEPDEVSAFSHRRAWWRCRKRPDHEWQAEIASRSSGRGCPFCAGKRASARNSLAVLAPKLAAQWHPVKNGRLVPKDVTVGSNRLVWWSCPKGVDHQWRASVHARAAHDTGCPFCRGLRLSRDNTLAARFPALAVEWHPVKNGRRRPSDIYWGSHLRVWWKCPRGPDHEWQTMCWQRVRLRSRCPFCLDMRVSVTNSLAARFPKIARRWHPTRNGVATPETVLSGGHTRYWWRCSSSGHTYFRSIYDEKRAAGCPVCYRQHRKARRAMTGRRRERIWLPSDLRA